MPQRPVSEPGVPLWRSLQWCEIPDEVLSSKVLVTEEGPIETSLKAILSVVTCDVKIGFFSLFLFIFFPTMSPSKTCNVLAVIPLFQCSALWMLTKT